MLSSMYSGITGLNANTQRMAVIGDNIANVNTTGYKGSEISFEDMVSQSIGGYTGQEIGGGVMPGKLSYDWNQGTIQKTSNPYDMAITGTGFFQVNDVTDPINPKTYYSRDGSFSFDAAGNLTTSSGLQVQGFKVTSAAGVTPVTIDTTTTNINIDPTKYNTITEDNNGVYYGVDASGVKTALYQIAVASPKNQSDMAKMSGNLYTNTTGSMNTPGSPGSGGLGTVVTSSLEASNVDIATEFVNMIEAQRAFSACSKVITTSDEILQELVSMKR